MNIVGYRVEIKEAIKASPWLNPIFFGRRPRVRAGAVLL
jgi:hypothetical protein